MERGITGQYEITGVAGERVRAYVPYPLPSDPPLVLDNARQLLLERATLALGRLDSISTLLPDPDLFLYAYVRPNLRDLDVRVRCVAPTAGDHAQ